MTIGMKNYKEMEICGSVNVVLYFRELAHMLLGDFVPGDVRGLRNKANIWLISLLVCVCGLCDFYGWWDVKVSLMLANVVKFVLRKVFEVK